jgi:hypothetical protein
VIEQMLKRSCVVAGRSCAENTQYPSDVCAARVSTVGQRTVGQRKRENAIKALECQLQRFGLQELRRLVLGAGQLDPRRAGGGANEHSDLTGASRRRCNPSSTSLKSTVTTESLVISSTAPERVPRVVSSVDLYSEYST